MNKKQKILLFRILLAAVFVLILILLPRVHPASFLHNGDLSWKEMLLLYLIPYLIVGYDILRKAVKGIVNGQLFDENFLMAIATIGAIGVGIYEHSSDYLEAIAVMLLYQVGELFQSYAVGKSRSVVN